MDYELIDAVVVPLQDEIDRRHACIRRARQRANGKVSSIFVSENSPLESGVIDQELSKANAERLNKACDCLVVA
ncbi:MAG TPA: hypothetical protein PKK10_04000 [Woeseiaceae bacterium]|nr:hypothetical protein [Woeseiaceae bacterium]